MTITPEQVRDLRPGDVVRLSDEDEGWTVEGALWNADGSLRCGTTLVRYPDGQPAQVQSRVMGVVSRAPRLYVNHDRTEAVPGDVVRDADSKAGTVWAFVHRNDENRQLPWQNLKAAEGDITRGCFRRELPTRLRLLVDGETGQVVQP